MTVNKTVLEARACIGRGEAIVIAEVAESAGSSPRKRGAWMLMTADRQFFGTVGGGKLEAEAEKLCRAALESKDDKVVTLKLTAAEQGGIDMRCGGDVSLRVAYLTPEEGRAFLSQRGGKETTAYIFGGGHVGLALERALRQVDFRTVVLDDREEFANRKRFPEADEVRVLADYKNAFDGIATDENSYIIIVTRGHAGDYDVLRQAVDVPKAYLGMIGSRKKVALAMENLRGEGVSEEAIAAVHAPIGLTIGAETPEEIAVSVAAEVIAVRAGVAL